MCFPLTIYWSLAVAVEDPAVAVVEELSRHFKQQM
jgi:hypothetical protein